MNNVIEQQATHLGYEICDYDIEAIKDRYFHFLHKNGEVNLSGVRFAIRQYFK